MKYDPSTKILTMTQTDLEHCGFNMEDFVGELNMAGMDDMEIIAAMQCHTIVISMYEGLYPR